MTLYLGSLIPEVRIFPMRKVSEGAVHIHGRERERVSPHSVHSDGCPWATVGIPTSIPLDALLAPNGKPREDSKVQ